MSFTQVKPAVQPNQILLLPTVPFQAAEPPDGAHLPPVAGSATKRKRTIRLLLVDDHPVVRKGLAAVLSRQPNLLVVGEAADGREALRKARELSPDLVLMDIDMPNMNGLTAAELLRKEQPRVKVMILSMHSQVEYVFRILQSGARGYVLKNTSTEDLLRAIDTIDGGETFYAPEVARVAVNQFVHSSGQASPGATLTNREREVLVAVAEGLSNKEIACRLDVGIRTIETHRERVMRKLDIHSVAGLTRFAIIHGFVAIPKAAAEAVGS